MIPHIKYKAMIPMCGIRRRALPGFYALLLSLASLLLTVGLPCADQLTLAKSIEVALENNPAAQIAKENVKKNSAYIDQASAQGMPKLMLEGSYMRLDEVSSIQYGGSTVDLNSLNNKTADLYLTQPLDVFGIIKLGRRMANLGRVSAQYDYERVCNDTTLEVKKAYYNVLRAGQYLRVQEDTVKQLEAHLKDAEANFAAGTVSKFEVLRAEAQLANARQGLISAQHGVELAKSAFNDVLGRDLSTPVDLAEPEMPEFVEIPIDKCVDLACRERPEVKSTSTQVELSDKMITIMKRGSKPKVDFMWKYNRNFNTNMFDPRSSSWRAYINTSVALFDGGATKASVEQAKSDAENAKSTYEQTVRGIMLDVQQSHLSLTDSEERIHAAEKGLELARESMRLAQLRYKGGISTQLEVLDAQATLTVAETNYINALYDYQVAFARLEKAVGGRVQMAVLLKDAQPARRVAESG